MKKYFSFIFCLILILSPTSSRASEGLRNPAVLALSVPLLAGLVASIWSGAIHSPDRNESYLFASSTARCLTDVDCVVKKDECGNPYAAGKHSLESQKSSKGKKCGSVQKGDVEAICFQGACVISQATNHKSARICEKNAKRVSESLKVWGKCLAPEDCISVSGGWPFPCQIAVNKSVHLKKISDAILSHQELASEAGCEIGNYKCDPKEAIPTSCVNGTCQLVKN